ncbi:MAG: TIM-barrel domain-containing protein [Phycisphaerales bacterium]
MRSDRSGRVRTAGVLGVMAMVFAAGGSVSAAEVADGVSGPIGKGIYCYFADAESQKDALPSLVFEKGRPGLGAAGGVIPDGPRFEANGEKTIIRYAIPADTSLYGTGSVAGPLLRNGRTVTLWNTDAYGYDDTNPSLYQSHPWILAVAPSGKTKGIMIDCSYRMTIAMPSLGGGDIVVTVDGGPKPPVIVIERDTPQEVVKALAEVTGTITLPPKWAIGYHQCRYSYNPDSKVKEIADGFRKRNIPLDVIWMDIDYMDKFRIFTFDKSQFPDPKGLNSYLHSKGVHNVWMIDPGVAADKAKFGPEGYFVFEQAMAGNHPVEKADGTTFFGEVWPGKCVFPDYTRKETREWWGGLYKDFMANGIDGIWNDMNEPAVFNVPSKTMPVDNLHRADPDLGGNGPHLRYHNVYGMFMVKASREGIMAANPDKRPFVLSRANFLGGHRYAATWTGDNSANWYHLENSVPMALNMGMSLQPFAGPDIGGFAGNGPAGGEGKLFARWMGFGAMMPFARGHTGKGNIDKEPWAFGPEVESTCRDAINRRMRFMPYLYTLFQEASIDGMPVIRPVYWADVKDPSLRSEDDAFMLGDDLIVVPDMVPDRTRVSALPSGDWESVDFTKPVGSDVAEKADPDLPKLMVRGGAIIPTSPVMQYVDEKPLDPLVLIVNLDEHGKASGTLYEDASEGWGYKTGDYLLTTYTAERQGNEVVVSVAGTEGKRARPARTVEVRLLEHGKEIRGGGTDGQAVRVKLN